MPGFDLIQKILYPAVASQGQDALQEASCLQAAFGTAFISISLQEWPVNK